jgi:hypothetical protein
LAPNLPRIGPLPGVNAPLPCHLGGGNAVVQLGAAVGGGRVRRRDLTGGIDCAPHDLFIGCQPRSIAGHIYGGRVRIRPMNRRIQGLWHFLIVDAGWLTMAWRWGRRVGDKLLPVRELACWRIQTRRIAAEDVGRGGGWRVGVVEAAAVGEGASRYSPGSSLKEDSSQSCALNKGCVLI